MSNKRVGKGGWIDDGKKLEACRECGGSIPKGRRRTFCSDACVDRWKLKTQPAYVRFKVFERDHGVCALCGADTEQMLKEARATWEEERRAGRRRWWDRPPSTAWEADHIIPVCEGGGECDLDNYRTLCVPCHKAETAKLAARRAQQRQQEREQAERAKRPTLPGF